MHVSTQLVIDDLVSGDEHLKDLELLRSARGVGVVLASLLPARRRFYLVLGADGQRQLVFA